MLAFVQMSRPWVWVFAVVIVLTFLLDAVLIAAPNIKKHVDLVALALAAWAFFYFYALLASQRGAVTIDADWWAAHKKAVAAFLTVLVTDATALVSLGLISGDAAHTVAVVLIAAAPILAFFGVKASPPNVPLEQ